MRIATRSRWFVVALGLLLLAATTWAAVGLGLTRVILQVDAGDTGYVTWYRYSTGTSHIYGPYTVDFAAEWAPALDTWYGIFSYGIAEGRYTQAWYTYKTLL